MKFAWRNFKFKKEVLAGCTTIFLLFLSSTQFAYAAPWDILNPLSWIPDIAKVVSYLIAAFLGIFIAIEAWLIGIVLNINANVMQTPFVQTGFSISLSIANLVFVLGIIVIAIATILRSNSYGMKKLLWRLVAMAILVNFGLVIITPIFAVGNSLTQYFMNCIGSSGSCTQTTDPLQFGTTMADAFAPQNAWKISSTGFSNLKTLNGAFSAGQDNPISSSIVPIFGILFVTIDMALIFFVLLAFIILLMIRYVYIAILAILLPLAWAGWVFPGFNQHFKSWWNSFIRWTFFSPVVLFFVYLAILTAQASTGVFAYQTYTGNGNSAWGDINAFITGALTPIFTSFLKEIVMVGLIIGGMIAADKFGIKFAGSAVKMAENGGDRLKGYIGKKSTQAAGRMVPKKLKEKLQAGEMPWVPQRVQTLGGNALGKLERKGRGDMVADKAKNAEALAKDPQEFARVLAREAGSFGMGATSKPMQMAMLEQLSKDENLQKAVAKEGNVVGGKNIQQFLKENEGDFSTYQKGKLQENLKDKYGLTPLELAQKNDGNQKTVLELSEKERLQEIKDIKARAAHGEKISEEDTQKVYAHEDRKEYLEWLNKEAVGSNADLMTDSERQELGRINAMETTSGDYMTADERKRYQAAKEGYEETDAKLKAWVTAHQDTAADTFQNHSKVITKLQEEGKPIPPTLEPAAVKLVQKAILTSMAEGFSPQNAKGLIDAIAKKNNLKYFTDAMDKMDEKTASQIRALAAANKPLATWIAKNPGRNIVDLNTMFGIKEEKPRKQSQEDDDES